LTEETHQKILKALDQMLADLSNWLRELGVSESDLMAVFAQLIQEDGIISKLIVQKSVEMVPFSNEMSLQPKQFVPTLRAVKSGEFATQLLAQPEPTAEELGKILTILRDSLPNFRQSLLQSGKMGPRYRRGGRSKELPDPEQRRMIRDEIKNLRGPGIKLKDLFGRLASRHQTSPTTIKRIWYEKTEEKP
jgi:hypothetical protein